MTYSYTTTQYKDPLPKLMHCDELAELLGVSISTVYKQAELNAFPFETIRIGSKKLFRRNEVELFLTGGIKTPVMQATPMQAAFNATTVTTEPMEPMEPLEPAMTARSEVQGFTQ